MKVGVVIRARPHSTRAREVALALDLPSVVVVANGDPVGSMLEAATRKGFDVIVDASDAMDLTRTAPEARRMLRAHLAAGVDYSESLGFDFNTMPRIINRAALDRLPRRWPYHEHLEGRGLRVTYYSGMRPSAVKPAVKPVRSDDRVEEEFLEHYLRYRRAAGMILLRFLEFEYFAFPLQWIVKAPMSSLRVLELGTGRLYGVALFLALAGARRAYALDQERAHRSSPEQEDRLYRVLRRYHTDLWHYSLSVDGRPADPETQIDRVFKPKGGRRVVNSDRLRWLCPASADAVPLPDRSIDLVVSFAALEHFEDPAAVARETYRVTSPGGWAIHWIDAKDHEDPTRPLRILRHREEQLATLPGGYVNRWRHRDYVRAFRRAGFKIAADLPRQVVRATASDLRGADPKFRGYPLRDLGIQFFGLVLQKPR